MRDLEFTGWWEGIVMYECDCCGKIHEFDFSDQEEANDYDGQRDTLRDEGWLFTKVKGYWKDFCCESCRNRYIREHTN